VTKSFRRRIKFAHTVGSDGMVCTANGRLAGSRGSRIYTCSDGRGGRWVGSKQQHHFLFRTSTDASRCFPKCSLLRAK
jgi:hypothetical protein